MQEKFGNTCNLTGLIGVVPSMSRTTPRRILLLYPRTPDTYWSYRHALKFVDKKALMPPLGLVTVAAIMGPEYSYRLVDLNVRPLEEADLEWAEMVMISAMIVQRSSMEESVRRCNDAGVPVVAGGPYPTSCHQEIEGVDHFVLGEGECTIPEFRQDLEAGTLKRVYRPKGRPEMKEVPIPRFDLCDLSAYDTFPLQFSRGCPFDCEFCDIVSLFGHRVRTKSPEQFVAEMEAAYQTGFRGSVFLVDDNFIGNRRRSKELLRAVTRWQQERGYPFNLSTEASIDLAEDPELLSLMVASGFTMVFVGLETPISGSLESIGKKQNLRRSMERSVSKIQRAGIEVTSGFIIGFDSDPPDIAERQIAFIQQLAIPTAMVGLLMALPNTKLWSRLEKEGRVLFRSEGNNTHEVELNFEPRLPKERLLAGYRKVLQTIYTPRHYFARCLTLIRRFPRSLRKGDTDAAGSVGRRELTAFGRSLLWQGFSGYGHWYWWFLLRAVALRPKLIVTIITLAVRGHHFFKITERTVRRGRELPAERELPPERADNYPRRLGPRRGRLEGKLEEV
ncbi:MAG: B12-binding domain-containing radical SAM protein [Alkalispirochaetaceae bacterium]